jgi:hypothetical protein
MPSSGNRAQPQPQQRWRRCSCSSPPLPSASLLSPTSASATPLIPLSLSLSRGRGSHPLPPHSSPPQLPPFCPPTFQPSKKPPQSQPTPTPTPRHAKRNPRSCDPAAPGRSRVPVPSTNTLDWVGACFNCPVVVEEAWPWRGMRWPRTRGRLEAAAAAEGLAMAPVARTGGGGGRAAAAGSTRSSRPTPRSCRCRYTPPTRVATAPSRSRCRRPCWSTCTSRRRRCCSPRRRRATGSPTAFCRRGGPRGDRGSRRRRRTPSPPRCCRSRTVKRSPFLLSLVDYFPSWLHQSRRTCVFICLMPLHATTC